MKYSEKKDALVLLADGTVFYGKAVGEGGTSYGEICFNTGMTGYQEIFTDPSYFGQIMVTTNAHIGNYGTQDSDLESDDVKIAGLVCKNFSYVPSRYSSDVSLEEFAKNNQLVIISDVDTRALVKYIRDHGAMNAVISSDVDNLDALKQQLKKTPNMVGRELASAVSTKEPYTIGESSATYRVAALDLGIKSNILRNLAKRDVYIKVFPYNTSFDALSQFEPDGYFISNGPGDPKPLKEAIETAKEIIDRKLPLFGICLGHQIIARAMGIDTYKMHTGHRGINHPILNSVSGKGEVTSQNHGFAVDRKQAEAHPEVTVTHDHLNDNTVAGISLKNAPCFSVQYHPEAGPGPNDATYLFDQFIDLMKENAKQPA